MQLDNLSLQLQHELIELTNWTGDIADQAKWLHLVKLDSLYIYIVQHSKRAWAFWWQWSDVGSAHLDSPAHILIILPVMHFPIIKNPSIAHMWLFNRLLNPFKADICIIPGGTIWHVSMSKPNQDIFFKMIKVSFKRKHCCRFQSNMMIAFPNSQNLRDRHDFLKLFALKSWRQQRLLISVWYTC